jgi:LPS O-antigen subunit length determinant protein (WzzB/FepE family)
LTKKAELMKRNIFLVLTGVIIALAAKAQEPRFSHYDSLVVIDGDTLPHFDLSTVNVFPEKKFKSRSDEQQYWRLVMRVKKVLPYAKEAAYLLKKYEQEVPPDAKGSVRREYVRKAEKELMNEYGPTLKNMSINDGRVLIKLIDRETSKVSYDLIHDLKGGFSAALWQGIARIFGNNLKSQYDPAGEDRQIEQIVQYIEMGII